MPRAPCFFRQIFELGQPVHYSLHGVLIVHVKYRLEIEISDYGGRHVDESHRGVLGVDVATALRAPFAFTQNRFIFCTGILFKLGDLIRAIGYQQRFGIPQGEGTDRAGRPMSARIAMAIRHDFRFAFQSELNRAAETTSAVNGFVTHVCSPLWVFLLPHKARG